MNPTKFIRPLVRELSAYHVEPYPCAAALDANESPYQLPDILLERTTEALKKIAYNRYPDPQAGALRRAIAAKERVNFNEVLLGNGSDEVIQALIAAVCGPGDRILVPMPTFSMYRLIASYLNVDTVEAPLLEDWSVDLEKTMSMIKKSRPKIIFLASPNNPTGATVSRDTILTIIKAAPGLVVVDEAYVDFAGAPLGPVFREHPNTVILRSFSKIGLAAIRLGYMMSDMRLSEQVNKVRLPYNINSMTQAVATEVAQGWNELTQVFDSIKKERGRMFEDLSAARGVTPFPSEANFLLMMIEKEVEEVFKSLLEDGVRVRWFKGDPVLGSCFRVTVGTPAENDRFLASLKKAL